VAPLSVAATVVSSVTVNDVSIYAGSSGAQGAYVLVSPPKPGIEGCTLADGNELWIDFA
jgi:hypothetical protein